MDERPDQRPRIPWFVAFLARRLVWAAITLLIFVAVVVLLMQVWVPYSWESRIVRGPIEDDRNYLGLFVQFLRRPDPRRPGNVARRQQRPLPGRNLAR